MSMQYRQLLAVLLILREQKNVNGQARQKESRCLQCSSCWSQECAHYCWPHIHHIHVSLTTCSASVVLSWCHAHSCCVWGALPGTSAVGSPGEGGCCGVLVDGSVEVAVRETLCHFTFQAYTGLPPTVNNTLFTIITIKRTMNY